MPNSRRLKLETRYFGTQWTLDVPNWLIRSSPAISKSNRFPFVVPLLDFNSVISKPHYSKFFFPIVPWDTCRIGLSYRARRKQNGKYIPPGTSSLTTGQSCLYMEGERISRLPWYTSQEPNVLLLLNLLGTQDRPGRSIGNGIPNVALASA